MPTRILLLVTAAFLMMAAKCNVAFDCSKTQIDKCDFQMRQIISSPDDAYKAISGERVCDGKKIMQEVVVYRKGETMDNRCGNAYMTADTLSPLSIEWSGHTLVVHHKTYNAPSTLLRQRKLLQKVRIAFREG